MTAEQSKPPEAFSQIMQIADMTIAHAETVPEVLPEAPKEITVQPENKIRPVEKKRGKPRIVLPAIITLPLVVGGIVYLANRGEISIQDSPPPAPTLTPAELPDSSFRIAAEAPTEAVPVEEPVPIFDVPEIFANQVTNESWVNCIANLPAFEKAANDMGMNDLLKDLGDHAGTRLLFARALYATGCTSEDVTTAASDEYGIYGLSLAIAQKAKLNTATVNDPYFAGISYLSSIGNMYMRLSEGNLGLLPKTCLYTAIRASNASVTYGIESELAGIQTMMFFEGLDMNLLLEGLHI